MPLVFTDDLKQEVVLSTHPERIVSLCPSITETLVKLGLSDKLVGRTDYCYRPENETGHIPKLGAPKDIRTEELNKADPQLIIAVREENDREQVQTIREKFPVFVFDITTYNQALDMINKLGELTGKEEDAVKMAHEIDQAFAHIPQLSSPLSFLYLVWKDPLMAAGKRTYINSILTAHGFINCLDSFIQRYVTLNIEVFKKLSFDMALLPCEPYEFTEEDRQDVLAFFPNSHVRLVDGEVFSWYGYRMKEAAHYLKEMIQALNKK